ncbi:MAG: hypothetical protein M1570_12265 [Chloroflexi bacterium]|nr:hypothetical protein [Chloroflexota bacterium]
MRRAAIMLAGCIALVLPLHAQTTRVANPTATFMEAVVLTTQAPQVERTFTMDGADTVDISVSVNSLTVQVTLVDPAGVSYLSGSQSGPVTTSGRYPDPTGVAQDHEFELRNPRPGLWKYRVVEPTTFSGVRAAIFSMRSSSDIVMGILGSGRDYPAGRAMSLGLVLADKKGGIFRQSLTSLQASVRTSGQPAQAITFVDDGTQNDDKANDGVYSATFTVNTPGSYAINVTAAGTSNGVAFVRTASALFNAISPCGTLSRTITSRARDTNGDGRNDALDVDFTVTAARAGMFNLSATLTASNGRQQTMSDFATLSTGQQQFRLSFPLTHLKALGVNAPHQVSDVYLYCMSSAEKQLTDQQFDLGSTVAFDLATADRRGIEPTGQNSDRAVDTNGNGLFDRLDYTLGLNILTAGSHQWTATLFDRFGREIDFASGSGSLPSGNTSALVSFSGSKIGLDGTDGPYFVRNLLISGPNSASVVLEAGTTQAYNYERFEQAFPRAPRVNANGIVNAASFDSPVARGSIASLFGVGLSPVLTSATFAPLPRTLEDVKVAVNGVEAPLFYVSPTQINFQVPYESPVGSAVPVVVSRAGIAGPTVSISVSDNAFGIFGYQRTSTDRDPIVTHQDYSLVTPDRPIIAGEALTLFATGIGSLNAPPATGEVATVNPLATSLVTPVITVGGIQAQVLFAGLAPDFVGLVQVNFIVPAGVSTAASTVPLTVRFGSAAATTVNLNVRRLPDLVLTAFVSSRTAVVGGTITGVSVTVKNQGTGDAGPFRIGYYLSTTSTVTTASIFTGWYCSINGLAAGASRTCSGDIEAPPSTSPGTYFLGAIADDLSQVTESNESNNVRLSDSGTLTISAPALADLVLTSFTASRTAAAGGKLTGLRLTVKNQGNGDAGPFRVGFYLSNSSTVTTASMYTGWNCTNTTGLAAGSTWDCSGDIGIPSSLAPGTYFLAAIVDDQGQVTESNESNNVRLADTGTVTITSGN